ncbi:MAG: PKD domain-containing protein [Gemmatimonadetes bacterium]|nr:PKD domain-containing protein [Gemmatimonadota bacterium]
MRHLRGNVVGLVALAALLTACGGGASPVGPNPPAPPPTPPPPPPPPSPIDVVLEAPLGSGGGTLVVTKAGSPLAGLKVTVEAGTYSNSTQWTISEMKEVRPSLPAKTRQIGSTIRIRNGQGFGTKPFRLSIPARVGRDSAVAAFFRDPSTGTLELMPLAARTDSSLVVVTQHLSAAQLVIPVNAPAFIAAPAAVPPTGEVEVILVGAALADLRFLIRSSFLPGVDDWDFVNRGSVLAPGGYCAGATLSALHHHYTRKAVHGALHGLYDELGTLEQDNPEGIRLASIVQRTGDWDGAKPGIMLDMMRSAVGDAGVILGGPAWVMSQAEALALALLTTGRAQALGIYQADGSQGHSIIAQAIEPGVAGGKIYVSDPNVPAVERILEYTPDLVTPFLFAANADRPATPYSIIVVMGVSALVDATRFDALWGELEARTIGDDLFHPVALEYRDPADTLWRSAVGPIKTASGSLTFRTLCAECKVARGPANDHLHRAFTATYKSTGEYVGDDREDLFPGVKVPVDLGTARFGMVHRVAHDDPQIREWLYSHFSLVAVERVPFRLLRHRFQAIAGQEITWSVTNGGIGGASSKYRFTFGPHAPPVETSFSGASVVHRFPTKGAYRATVDLFDPAGIRLATDSVTMNILEGYHWRMDCVEFKSDNPSASFTAAQASAYQRWINHGTQIAGKPSDGFLSLLTPSTFRQFGSFFVVTKPGQGATARALPLFPADSTDSPPLAARVYTGSASESPGGPPGFSRTYGGGVRDNIFGAQMVTGLSFSVSGAGWARGTLIATVAGFSPAVTIRFYARQIWEPNPAPAPPCAFGKDW